MSLLNDDVNHFQVLKVLTGAHDLQHFVHLHMDNFQHLNSLHFYWKDSNGKYLGGNHYFAAALGFQGIDEMQGLTDFDFPFLPKEEAASLRRNDLNILIQKTPNFFIEPVTLHCKQKCLAISHKAPLLSHTKKIVGIIGVSLILPKELLGLESQGLAEKLVFKDRPMHIEKNELFSCLKKIIGLTPKEIRCLSHWASSFSIKKSANILNVSHKTIETHRGNILYKTNCRTRQDLIAFLYKKNILHLLLEYATMNE